jgi:hypothetical protein
MEKQIKLSIFSRQGCYIFNLINEKDRKYLSYIISFEIYWLNPIPKIIIQYRPDQFVIINEDKIAKTNSTMFL